MHDEAVGGNVDEDDHVLEDPIDDDDEVGHFPVYDPVVDGCGRNSPRARAFVFTLFVNQEGLSAAIHDQAEAIVQSVGAPYLVYGREWSPVNHRLHLQGYVVY